MGAGPRIKCLTCGDIIQSRDRHDFVSCSCRTKQEMADEKFISDYNDLLGPITDMEKDDLRIRLNKKNTSISVDGGNDYLKMSTGPKAVWEMWNDTES